MVTPVEAAPVTFALVALTPVNWAPEAIEPVNIAAGSTFILKPVELTEQFAVPLKALATPAPPPKQLKPVVSQVKFGGTFVVTLVTLYAPPLTDKDPATSTPPGWVVEVVICPPVRARFTTAFPITPTPATDPLATLPVTAPAVILPATEPDKVGELPTPESAKSPLASEPPVKDVSEVPGLLQLRTLVREQLQLVRSAAFILTPSTTPFDTAKGVVVVSMPVTDAGAAALVVKDAPEILAPVIAPFVKSPGKLTVELHWALENIVPVTCE
jgi:hypothetical protein